MTFIFSLSFDFRFILVFDKSFNNITLDFYFFLLCVFAAFFCLFGFLELHSLLLAINFLEFLDKVEDIQNLCLQMIINFLPHIVLYRLKRGEFEYQLRDFFQGVQESFTSYFLLLLLSLLVVDVTNNECEHWWLYFPHLVCWIFLTDVFVQATQTSPQSRVEMIFYIVVCPSG